MTNKYRSSKSNMSRYTAMGYGKGWKPKKWNPDEEFPINGFVMILNGLYKRSVGQAFTALQDQGQLDEIRGNLQDLQIEDQIVENSNKEIEYLNGKEEELNGNLNDIKQEIVQKKENASFKKDSDLACIVFLKAMNELREVEIQKNMIDYAVYKLVKDNWLSELVIAFHITNNNAAIESFNKE